MNSIWQGCDTLWRPAGFTVVVVLTLCCISNAVEES